MSYESFGRDLASKGQKSVKYSPIGLEHQKGTHNLSCQIR